MLNVCAARYPEGVKTSGWVASAVGAVVIVGGGIWGVQALTADPGGEAHMITDYAPDETPAASTEPTEPVETSTVEPDETVEPTSAPVTVEPQPSGEPMTPEAEYLYVAGDIIRGFGYEITDDELVEAGAYSCEQTAAGANRYDIIAVEGVTESMNNGVVSAAIRYLCPQD